LGLFSSIEDILIALLLLILLGRSLGLLARRLKVSPMVGEVMGGLLLSPLLLGLLEAGTDLSLFADFAIIVIMFHSGVFTDFSSFKSQKNSSLIIGALGVIVTFGLIFTSSYFVLQFGFKTSLFLGAILSNSAIEVCATLLRDVKNERLRTLVVGASFVDDIMAVFVLGVVLTFVGTTQENALPILGGLEYEISPFLLLSITSVKVVSFLFLTFMVISRLYAKVLDRFIGRGFEVVMTIGFLTAFALGIFSRWVGLHEVIGVYLAGLLFSRWGILPDPMLSRGIAMMKFKQTLNAMMESIFSPIFFGFVGILLGGALSGIEMGEASVLIFGLAILGTFALAGKVVGCGAGARFMGFKPAGAMVIGIAMGGRGALEFILIQSGLEKGLLDQNQFSLVITVTLMTILLTPVLFRMLRSRLPLDQI